MVRPGWEVEARDARTMEGHGVSTGDTRTAVAKVAFLCDMFSPGQGFRLNRSEP